MLLLLDAGGTLIRPAEPVGDVYDRHLQSCGLTSSSAALEAAFSRSLAAAPPPDYPAHPSGHDAEFAWWRGVVRAAFRSLGGPEAAFAASPDFDAYFALLFTHYADPAAWTLFPDVRPFLESAAARRARLAVLSNFDDRLAPILDGLGVGSFFDLVLTSANARARKPEKRIFHFALEHLGASPAETTYAGDSHHADVLGAQAAGIRPFHLQRPATTLSDFLDFSLP